VSEHNVSEPAQSADSATNEEPVTTSTGPSSETPF